uniref:Uncharacterized protein n=1 Tax=Meloidogyne enterolobii TaxID=390850 RepID=A0A6V7VCS8_MELEN|nr:unnamed protein product [Meloidogyne enterolobii]
MAHREERKIRNFIKLFWLLFVILIVIFQIKYTDAQNDSGENQEKNNIPLRSELPLATGKWNQFKGFYTPRPIPSNAHFTFASVWASWSAWSYCTNNIQMRVRACNTVRGFSCLGPNRDIRPCGNILGEIPPNRQRIQQIPLEPNSNHEQFELEDPWAEDRREALKQLYEKQIPRREENVEKVKRPELFASKNIENIQIKNENVENKLKNEEMPGRKSEEEGSEEEENNEEEENKLEEDFKSTITGVTTSTIKTTTITSPQKTFKTELFTNTTTTLPTTTFNYLEKQRKLEFYNARGITTSPQKLEKERKDLLKQKINNQQQKVIPANLGNDTARALEWMVEGISKSLEQQPPQILQNNQKNKLIESKNTKEENEQEIEEEEENEEEGGEVDEDKVKNRRRPLLHSGELEENEDSGDLISSTSLPATTIPTTTTSTTTIQEPKINKEKAKILQNNNVLEENKLNKKGGNLNANQRKRLMKELVAAQKLKQLQIDQSKERILQQQNQQKQKTQSTTIEKQLTKLKAEMHAMEAVLERMKNTEGLEDDDLGEEKEEGKNKENEGKAEIKVEKIQNHKRNEGKTEIKNAKEQPNRETTTKLPATPKIVLPIKIENNKNHRHLNNPRPIPILIGDQKIIVSSAAIPQLSSTKKPSLPLNNSFVQKKNNNKEQQTILTTTSKPLLFMKTSIQRRNNRGNLISNNNTNVNKKIILTENPGSIWLDGSIPRVGSTAKWSDWNDWGECFCGKQMRSRTCIYEDNSFQSQGCSGKSYESRSCISTTEQCPTTIPPIPPSKQLQLISKKEKPSLNILRRTSLSIGPLTNVEDFKKGSEGQNHQRLSENEILRHRHRLFLAQRHRMMRYKN